MAQWAHYSTPDPELVQVLAGMPSLRTATIDDIDAEDADFVSKLEAAQREVAELSRVRVEEAGPPVGITVEERRVIVSKPPGEIAVRVYTPELGEEGETETFPAFIQLHGGGYCLGSLDSDELKCRTLCATHRAVIVNVDYRLAPAFPWPTGINDSYTTVKWVAKNASALRVDLTKGLVVGGTSAGANFTCIIAQRAREDPELKGKITGQVLQIPSTCSNREGYPERYRDQLLSYAQNNNDPILSPGRRNMFMAAYKPGPPLNPETSPLLAETFVGLAPAYVQIAGADPLRDEGLLYAQLLQKDGVPTKVEVYPGVPHGFASYFPQLAASARWRADLDVGLRWLFGRD
ncbi:hypothetical protein M0805_002054 [Coniferiporia weirii]|nr:hypothetical protein M0805_002054 [Coniferiporia weirii]